LQLQIGGAAPTLINYKENKIEQEKKLVDVFGRTEPNDIAWRNNNNENYV